MEVNITGRGDLKIAGDLTELRRQKLEFREGMAPHNDMEEYRKEESRKRKTSRNMSRNLLEFLAEYNL